MNAEFRIQNADVAFRMRIATAWCRRGLLCLHFSFCILNYAYSAEAQVGRTVTEIAIEQEGKPVSDPVIVGLIETRVGSPLAVKDVRETITHLMSLNRFDDVEVSSEDAGGGI